MTVGVAIRPASTGDSTRWDAFVASCGEATFFHRFAWREVYESVFRHRTHYLLAERGDEVIGVLPLVELRSLLFGHSLCSLPFALYGGVAATDPAAVPALHEAAVTLGRQLGVQHLELRNRMPRAPEWPRQDLYVTFRREIDPQVEANLLAIPRKQRAMVRKGHHAPVAHRDRHARGPFLRPVRSMAAANAWDDRLYSDPKKRKFARAESSS